MLIVEKLMAKVGPSDCSSKKIMMLPFCLAFLINNFLLQADNSGSAAKSCFSYVKAGIGEDHCL